ncbi:MAG: hypothetical protein GXP62_18895 [Oligoflexia bacterium]|nr:hypothetical protein [Oligoflexia bacterium]
MSTTLSPRETIRNLLQAAEEAGLYASVSTNEFADGPAFTVCVGVGGQDPSRPASATVKNRADAANVLRGALLAAELFSDS